MGTGAGGQSVEDMERVIAAMRRVVERLQNENETLKKQNIKQIHILNSLKKISI